MTIALTFLVYAAVGPQGEIPTATSGGEADTTEAPDTAEDDDDVAIVEADGEPDLEIVEKDDAKKPEETKRKREPEEGVDEAPPAKK